MKKLLILFLTICLAISLTACTSGAAQDAIDQGDLAIASGDYETALNSYKLAIEKGADDEATLEMCDILELYITIEDAISTENYHIASELANKLVNYEDTMMADVVDELISKATACADAKDSLEQAQTYLNSSSYAEATVVLDSIDTTLLTENLIAEVNSMKETINNRKANQTATVIVPSGYYIPSNYSGVVPIYNGSVLFPSDTHYITNDYLDLCSRNEVALIRNEIYARHGYIFKKAEYKNYFGSKSWYNGQYTDATYVATMFNSIENANIKTITGYEKAKGWN